MKKDGLNCAGLKSWTGKRKGRRFFDLLSSFLLFFAIVVVAVFFPVNYSRAGQIFDLGEIVITATKFPQLLKDTPGSVTVITAEEIKSSRAKNVAELLDKVAGVDVKSYGLNGISSISLRGSSANQVLVMIDGRGVNLASSGDVDLSEFPLNSVEKIEVIRGPFSALYGGGALGGVINIITKNPPKTPVIRACLSCGNFNASSYSLLYGKGNDKAGYLFTGEKGYSGGDRQNSWKDFFNLTGKVVYSPFVLSGGYYQDKRGIPGSIDWPTPASTQENRKSWLDLTCKWKRGGSYFSFKGYLNQDEIIYENPDWFQKDTTESKTYGVNFQDIFFFNSRQKFIWGVSLRRDEVDVRTIDGTSRIGGKKGASLGALYLESQVKTFPDFVVVLGARYDSHSIYGYQLSPRVSFLYRLGELTSLRGSWGSAFRPPTMDDLYWKEDWGGGMGLFGNPNLIPERSSEYEVGIEHIFSSRILGRITFFSSCVDNLISWTEVSPYRWEPQNVDRAKINGLEGEVKVKPFKKLSFILNYTYLKAKDDKEFKGNFLPYRPQNKLFLALDYEVQPNLQLPLEGKVVGERYADRENTEKLPPYSLVGAKLSFKLAGKYNVFIKVDNLFNEKYADIKGYPMPGRTVKGGVEVTL
ncbi:TonB-dependent receptor [Candidatus Aerophobetes bacterium]|nr:TonB-dependent receptor [Candidatus Aerophobetes bacterium]